MWLQVLAPWISGTYETAVISMSVTQDYIFELLASKLGKRAISQKGERPQHT
jgi:hypothetical protein